MCHGPKADAAYEAAAMADGAGATFPWHKPFLGRSLALSGTTINGNYLSGGRS